MSTTRKLAFALGLARVGYAAALLVAPARTSSGWLGEGGDTAGGRIATRALGFRDGMLSAGIAAAALADRPLRPWLLACAAADVVDVTSTFADADGLPEKAPLATLAVAGGTAAAGIALALTAD